MLRVAFALWGIAAFCLATPLRAQDWERAEQVPAEYIFGLLAHQGTLYVAADTTLHVSTDRGRTWTATMLPSNATAHLSALFGLEETVFVGTTNEGLFATTDGGATWQAVSQGLANSGVAGFAVLGDSLYAATDGAGVFVLDVNDRSRWHSYNTGIPYRGITAIGATATHLLAGAGAEGHVYVRSRAGNRWQTVELDTLGQEVWSILTGGDHVFVGADKGIYRGRADGTAWQKVGFDFLADGEVPTVVRAGTHLYAGVRYRGEHFICFSDDEGATWEVRAHEYAELDELAVFDGRLWAARSDGLWYLPIDTGTPTEPVAEVPAALLYLGQNAPNPFVGRTAISIELSRASVVSLRVYDLTGRHVATLLDGATLAPGAHALAFEAAGLPAGTYVYRLQTSDGTATRRMVVLR